MQLSPGEHARFLHGPAARRPLRAAARAALVVALAAGLAACGEPPGVESIAGGRASPFVPAGAPTPDTAAATGEAPPPSSPARDSALAVLERMDRTALDSSFARLRDRAYVRHTRLDRLGPGGAVRAWRTRTLRYAPEAGAAPDRVAADRVAADSAGAPGRAPLSGLASSANPQARLENPVPYALPDQPAYLSPRTREAFAYRLTADTLGFGPGRSAVAVQVVEVRARPGAGDDQSIRYARLVVTRADRALVAASVVRAERTLFFREDSRFSLLLRPGPAGAWLPGLTRFRARVDVPFRAPRQFRTASAYYGFGNAS
jgi:hypothetical protein